MQQGSSLGSNQLVYVVSKYIASAIEEACSICEALEASARIEDKAILASMDLTYLH